MFERSSLSQLSEMPQDDMHVCGMSTSTERDPTHIEQLVLGVWRAIEWDDFYAESVIDELPREAVAIKARIVELHPSLHDDERAERWWLAAYDTGEEGQRAKND